MTTASKCHQLFQNYLTLHTVEAPAYPYSAVFYNLPTSILTPCINMTNRTQLTPRDLSISQEALGPYLHWVYSRHAVVGEDKYSCPDHKTYNLNKERPSVIQSTGRVVPLEEHGTNFPSTDDSLLSSNNLISLTMDGNHDISRESPSPAESSISNHTHVRRNSSFLTSNNSIFDKFYKNNNIPDLQQVTTGTAWDTNEAEIEKSEYRFYCRFCNKPYHWRSHWKAHERIHTGERPFKCEICGKSFTRSDGLQCHRLTHWRKKGSTLNSMLKEQQYGASSSISTKDKSFDHVEAEKCSQNVTLKQVTTERRQEEQQLHTTMFPNIMRKDHFKNPIHCKVTFSNGKKEFSCRLCRKKFLSSHGLQHHLRRHSKA